MVPTIILLFSNKLEVLVNARKKEKEIKDMDRKERTKLSLFEEEVVIQRKFKRIDKVLELIAEFSDFVVEPYELNIFVGKNSQISVISYDST